ncbi:MAG: N-acyl homoserine lactonase family protein [Anaerolineae bacterium]|nr:N-acyl homoserine lactonase family protein [Anaerolineae bacterium]
MTTATPQRLYLLPFGITILPRPTTPLVMSSGCYLVQLSDGRNILIDTGLPAEYTHAVGTPPTENEKSMFQNLADLNLTPADIDTVICTHFDIDHAGNNDAFPHAELIVQRSHYELARSGHERFADGRAHWDHPDLRYRLIDGDTELLPGLTLLETSGHTLGHQSVLLHLPNTGNILLAIDAVSFGSQFTIDRTASPVEDLEQVLASTRKLIDIAEREKVALVIFHHDGKQWQTLKTAPAFYD